MKKNQFLPEIITFNTMTPLTEKWDPIINLWETETENVLINVPPPLRLSRRNVLHE